MDAGQKEGARAAEAERNGGSGEGETDDDIVLTGQVREETVTSKERKKEQAGRDIGLCWR
jgi:hypothetical protein